MTTTRLKALDCGQLEQLPKQPLKQQPKQQPQEQARQQPKKLSNSKVDVSHYTNTVQGFLA